MKIRIFVLFYLKSQLSLYLFNANKLSFLIRRIKIPCLQDSLNSRPPVIHRDLEQQKLHLQKLQQLLDEQLGILTKEKNFLDRRLAGLMVPPPQSLLTVNRFIALNNSTGENIEEENMPKIQSKRQSSQKDLEAKEKTNTNEIGRINLFTTNNDNNIQITPSRTSISHISNDLPTTISNRTKPKVAIEITDSGNENNLTNNSSNNIPIEKVSIVLNGNIDSTYQKNVSSFISSTYNSIESNGIQSISNIHGNGTSEKRNSSNIIELENPNHSALNGTTSKSSKDIISELQNDEKMLEARQLLLKRLKMPRNTDSQKK